MKIQKWRDSTYLGHVSFLGRYDVPGIVKSQITEVLKMWTRADTSHQNTFVNPNMILRLIILSSLIGSER